VADDTIKCPAFFAAPCTYMNIVQYNMQTIFVSSHDRCHIYYG